MIKKYVLKLVTSIKKILGLLFRVCARLRLVAKVLIKKILDFAIREIIDYSHNKFLYFVATMLMILYMGYETVIMSWYNERIIPIFSSFKSNIGIEILISILIIIAFLDICNKCHNRYLFERKIVFVLSFVLWLLISYRWSGAYHYFPFLMISNLDIKLFLLSFPAIIVIFIFLSKILNIYLFEWKKVFVLSYVLWLLIRHWWSEEYNILTISYVDVIWFFSSVYIVLAVFNWLRVLYCRYNKKSVNEQELVDDMPIKYNEEHKVKCGKSEDEKEFECLFSNLIEKLKSKVSREWILKILSYLGLCLKWLRSLVYNDKNNSDCSIESDETNFKQHALNLVDKIKKLDCSKTWSLAIVAPWGGGKTSFLNIIMGEIKKDGNYEVVYFIPRNSKSVETIQEDFFSCISCVLSKYDSRFSSTLKAYMASLQLIDEFSIDEFSIVKKLVNFYQCADKEDLRDKIEKSFASLKRKVLVVIDDFDRLSRDEILEVLKLIDRNAAFTNIIFLTAFDKEHVNKILRNSDDKDNKDNTDNACFIDKFFNLEYSLPPSPMTNYLIDIFNKQIVLDENEKNAIKITITNKSQIFEKNIHTIRDVKRYVNQFVVDYECVKGEVRVRDFLLVQLIKYSYPKQYESLRKKEYLQIDLEQNSLGKKYYLCKEENVDEKVFPILKLLFPESDDVNRYRSISSNESFDNYFARAICNPLSLDEMHEALSLKWEEAKRKIDGWANNIVFLNELICYLEYHCECNNLEKEFVKNHVTTIAYIACKLQNIFSIYRNTLKTNDTIALPILLEDEKRLNGKVEKSLKKILSTDWYDEKEGVEIKDVKKCLLDIILNEEYDSELKLARKLHEGFINGPQNGNSILNDNDLWQSIKDNFIKILKDPTAKSTADEEMLLARLHSSIVVMNGSKTNLDKECVDAYRNYVKNNPEWYVSNFVREKSSPLVASVTCEPLWRKIFEDESTFETFLTMCLYDDVKNSGLAYNFWQLYKNNGFHDIRFDKYEYVHECLENNLVDEVSELDELLRIQDDVSKIPENIDSISEDEKEKYRQSLNQSEIELKNVKLKILLYNNITKEIERKLMIYK